MLSKQLATAKHLADTRRTKWWTHHQFIFIVIVGVAEANANNSWARARSEIATPQLDFRKKLAKEMLNNKILDDGTCSFSPIRPRKRQKTTAPSATSDATRGNLLFIPHGMIPG